MAAQALVRFPPGPAEAQRRLAAGTGHGDGVVDPGCALRSAADARLKAHVAARLSKRRVACLDRTGRCHPGRHSCDGVAGTGRDRGLRGGAQPAGLGGVVVARTPGLTRDGGGRAVQPASRAALSSQSVAGRARTEREGRG